MAHYLVCYLVCTYPRYSCVFFDCCACVLESDHLHIYTLFAFCSHSVTCSCDFSRPFCLVRSVSETDESKIRVRSFQSIRNSVVSKNLWICKADSDKKPENKYLYVLWIYIYIQVVTSDGIMKKSSFTVPPILDRWNN